MTGPDAGSDPSTDAPRPRPQYGEYATPEEQRARIRQPHVTHSLDAGASVSPPRHAPAPAPQGAAPTPPSLPETRLRRRLIDRIVTVALLTYGLFNVIGMIPAITDFGAYAHTVLTTMGIDATMTDPAAGQPWGIAAAVVLGLGWLLTAALSWLQHSRGRLSWWIPLVGGVLFTIVAGTLMMIPLMSDPGVRQAILATAG